MTALQPKDGYAWVLSGVGVQIELGVQPPAIWDHPSGIRVLSAIEPTNRKLEYHVSVSRNGQKATDADLEIVYQAWPIKGWEEDNHGMRARNFWKPVERDLEGECPCKEEGK
jgi:hypothetical protein